MINSFNVDAHQNIIKHTKMTCITDACINGNLDEVKQILNNLNRKDRDTLLATKDENGNTCYLLSFIHKQYDVLRYICKGKSETELVLNDVFINIDNKESLNCKLHNIIENLPELTEDDDDIDVEANIPEHVEETILNKIKSELLINKDILKGRDFEYNTPLHIACQNRYFEVVKLLLENGANVNAVNVYLQEPIHILCDLIQKDTPEMFANILRLLLDYGANLNALDVHYETPCDKVFCQQQDIFFPFQYTSTIQKAFSKISIDHMIKSMDKFKKENSLTSQIQELLIYTAIEVKKMNK